MPLNSLFRAFGKASAREAFPGNYGVEYVTQLSQGVNQLVAPDDGYFLGCSGINSTLSASIEILWAQGGVFSQCRTAFYGRCAIPVRKGQAISVGLYGEDVTGAQLQFVACKSSC